MPRFTPKSYAKLSTKYKCNFIAGVPTLYTALLQLPGMERVDLSFLKGVFSGGDSLSAELKKKLDAFRIQRPCQGTTEKGLEPLLTESESAVLPITPSRNIFRFSTNKYYYTHFKKKVNTFFHIF